MTRARIAGVGMIPFTKPGESEDWDVMAEKAIRLALACHRQTHGAYGSRPGNFAQEYEAFVFIHDRLPFPGMAMQIIHDPLHAGMARFQQAPVTHQLTDAGIVATILAIITNAYDAAIDRKSTRLNSSH